MACYNPDTEEFQSVCRVMSGFSDAFYKEVSRKAKLYEIGVCLAFAESF